MLKREKFLVAGEAHVAIKWPTPGFLRENLLIAPGSQQRGPSFFASAVLYYRKKKKKKEKKQRQGQQTTAIPTHAGRLQLTLEILVVLMTQLFAGRRSHVAGLEAGREGVLIDLQFLKTAGPHSAVVAPSLVVDALLPACLQHYVLLSGGRQKHEAEGHS